MDFITDIKGPLLERFSPEQVNDIVDIITLALVRYDVEPKSTALVEYKADDFELVQKFFVAKATEGLTQNTLRYYKTVLQKALKTFNKHIKDITTNDVRAYIVSMKFRGNTERTQNNERRVLSSFFKFLLAEGEITTNPMLRINKIKEPKKLKKPLSETELETVRIHAKCLRDKAIIEFLYSTGCRVSEMCALDIKDVDFEKGEVVVFGKGKKYRTAYLTTRCALYLKEYLNRRTDNLPYLFTNLSPERLNLHKHIPIDRLSTSLVEQTLRKLGRRLGIENVHPHRFRRTCATVALHRGMPIDQVRLMLGHENLDTTTIYAEESSEVVKQSHAKYL